MINKNMTRKITIVFLGLLLSFRLLQAQPKPVLPFWNCPEEKPGKAQKREELMNQAIRKGVCNYVLAFKFGFVK